MKGLEHQYGLFINNQVNKTIYIDNENKFVTKVI